MNRWLRLALEPRLHEPQNAWAETLYCKQRLRGQTPKALLKMLVCNKVVTSIMEVNKQLRVTIQLEDQWPRLLSASGPGSKHLSVTKSAQPHELRVFHSQALISRTFSCALLRNTSSYYDECRLRRDIYDGRMSPIEKLL